MNQFLKRSWAEINLKNLTFNLNQLQSLAPNKEIMAVVKANAYGHGAVEVSRCLAENNVSHFAVSNILEGVELRENGILGEILIFGYTQLEFIQKYHHLDFTYTIPSLEYGKELGSFAVKNHLNVTAHVKINSGMNRLGVDTKAQLEEILALDGVNVTGAYTHFSVADSLGESNQDYTKKQQEKFLSIVEGHPIKLHSQNSGGTLYHPSLSGDFIRTGISLYGQIPDASQPLPIELKPVLQLKSTIAQIKEVGEKEKIGYGLTYETSQKLKVAAVPIGYADGYYRGFSNKAFMTINGHLAPVVGRVSMDITMVDITQIPNVKIGDTVTVYSDNPNEFTPDDGAKILNTINYEILCGISGRVPRIIV